jgi:hypothetical protein
MVAEAEVMHQAAVPVLDVQYHRRVAEEVVGVSAPAEVGVEVDFAVDVPQMVSGWCSCFSVPLFCKKNHFLVCGLLEPASMYSTCISSSEVLVSGVAINYKHANVLDICRQAKS